MIPWKITLREKKPMTKVQKAVMARFDNGERLVFKGDNIYWVKQYREGWCVSQKALYPQLRRLFWYGEIRESNPEQVIPAELVRF